MASKDFRQGRNGGAGGENGPGIEMGEVAEAGIVVEDGPGGDDGPGADGGIGVNHGMWKDERGLCNACGRGDVGRGMDEGQTTNADGNEAVMEDFSNGKIPDGNGYGRIGRSKAFEVGERGNGGRSGIVKEIGGGEATGGGKFGNRPGVGTGTEDQDFGWN